MLFGSGSALHSWGEGGEASGPFCGGGDEERMERKGCTDTGVGEIKMKKGRRD